MHNELSPLDELFRNANQEQEKIPVEGNWENMQKKIRAKGIIKKRFFIILLFSLGSLLAISTLLYLLFHISNGPLSFSSNKKDKTAHSNTINNSNNQSQKLTDALNTEKGHSILANNFSNDTNRKANTSTNYYKVQIGAFKKNNRSDIFPQLRGLIVEEKDGYHKYYAGVYTNYDEALKKLKEMKDLGFNDAFIPNNISPVRNSNTLYNTESTASVEKIENNDVPLQNIQQPAIQPEQQMLNEKDTLIPEVKEKPILTEAKVKDTAAIKLIADIGIAKTIEAIKSDTSSPFSLGFYSSYDIDHFRINSQNAYGTYLLDSSNSQLSGSSNTTFTFCIQTSYRFNKNLSVEMGAAYSQKKKLELNNLQYYNEESYSFNYNGKYIEVPLRLKYYVNQFKPVSFFVSPGIVFNANYPAKKEGYFLLEHPLDSMYYERVTLQPNSIGTSLQIGVGMEYLLQKKWRLFVASYYNYGLSAVVKHPTYKNIPVKHFNNSVNIGFGIYYDF